MSPYPDTFQESISLADYVTKYGELSNGSRLTDHVESLAGSWRIMEKRSSSEKLFLYDLYDRGVKIGVTADVGDSDMEEVEFSRHHSRMEHGDFVGICGHPGKSENGEPSIFAKKFMVLSHCLHMLPSLGADDSSVKERDGKRKANIWVPGMKTSPETYAVKDKICNAYTELNDPVMKRQRFVEELKNLRSGDDEAMAVDDPFCNALGYELPQTGCWRMGIERLTMSLTESQNIKASLEEKLKAAEAKAARAEAACAEAEVFKKLALEKAEESKREALEEAAKKAKEILYLAVEEAVRKIEEEALAIAKYHNSERYIGKCVQGPMEPTCSYHFLSEEPGLDLAPELGLGLEPKPELELKQFYILENGNIPLTEDIEYCYLGG